MPPLEAFDAVCQDFYQPARDAAAQGKRVAGFMCSYSPQELIHAAGYLPVRILGQQGATPQADELLQAYACSLARASLNSGLSGSFDFLNLAVFAHTCDTMQNVADLWQRNVPGMETLIVSMPTRTQGAAASQYLRIEFNRVRAWLEARVGAIADERIAASMQLYQRHRAAMQRLYALRRRRTGILSGAEMNTIVLSAMLMPKEDHLLLLNQLIDQLEVQPEISDMVSDAPRILVTGSICQNRDYITVLEEAGCVIADDDLCMGSRSFTAPDPGPGDPLDALTGQYLGRRPCPAFHSPGFDPGDHLVERAQQARAEGVVFLLTKFCDPWFFDYPPARKKLDAAGIPSLLVEIEQNQPVPEQFRTRAQAFFETIELGGV
jgi:bcr-type benzoyl-CoA reductase subunit C